MISMTCTCKGEVWVRDRLAGSSTPCPSCGRSLVVPLFGTVRASMSSATCKCGEIFWSSAWQPGKLSQCPICANMVGPSKSEGDSTVILPPGAGESLAVEEQGGPGHPVHSRQQPGTRNDAMRTTAAATKEEPPAVGPTSRGRRLARAVAKVVLLAVGLLILSRLACNPDEVTPPSSTLTSIPGEDRVSGGDVDPPPPPLPTPTAGLGRPGPMKILIPAYFFPGGAGLDDWKRVFESARRVPIVAVVNPASGPGDAPIPNYSDILRGGDAIDGLTMIGYVNTAFANRDRSEIEADIDRWVEFYPEIQGIFLDAQSDAAEHAGFYTDLSESVRQSIDDALVVTNPGLVCPEVYFAEGAADVAVIFENVSGFDEFDLPLWRYRYRPERFAALPYGMMTTEAMEEAIRQAGEKGIGYLFVTDGDMPNPWYGLPPYWDEMVDAVEQVNAGLTKAGL